jgi:hypothetical protein
MALSKTGLLLTREEEDCDDDGDDDNNDDDDDEMVKVLLSYSRNWKTLITKCKAQAFALYVLGRWKRKNFPQRKTIVCNYML